MDDNGSKGLSPHDSIISLAGIGFGILDIIPLQPSDDALLPEDLEEFLLVLRNPASPNLVPDMINFHFDLASCGLHSSCADTGVVADIIRALLDTFRWNLPRAKEVAIYVLAAILSRGGAGILPFLSLIEPHVHESFLISVGSMDLHRPYCTESICEECPLPICVASLTFLAAWQILPSSLKSLHVYTDTFLRVPISCMYKGGNEMRAAAVLLRNLEGDNLKAAVDADYLKACVYVIQSATCVSDVAILAAGGISQVFRVLHRTPLHIQMEARTDLDFAYVADKLLAMMEIVHVQEQELEETGIPTLKRVQHYKIACLAPAIMDITWIHPWWQQELLDANMLECLTNVLRHQFIPDVRPCLRALELLHVQNPKQLRRTITNSAFVDILAGVYYSHPLDPSVFRPILNLVTSILRVPVQGLEVVQATPGIILMLLECLRLRVCLPWVLKVLAKVLKTSRSLRTLARHNHIFEWLQSCRGRSMFERNSSLRKLLKLIQADMARDIDEWRPFCFEK